MALSITYKIAESDGSVGYQPISEISTTKKHALGTRVRIVDQTNVQQGEAMYVAFKASTAVAAGIVVVQDVVVGGTETPFNVVAVVAATHQGKGVPLYVNLTAVTSVASVQYGWVLVVGVATTLKTAVKILAASALGVSATDGRVFISVTSIDQILGARLCQSSVTTTTSTVDIFWNRAHTAAAVTAA